MLSFSAYIALGDSISIDLYPALDKGEQPTAPLGAASLLYARLKERNPALEFANLCVDGATTFDLLDDDALRLVGKYKDQRVLITLTLGGNDLLWHIRDVNADIMSEIANTLTRMTQVVDKLVAEYPHATIVLNSIYDPTDNTGVMPKMPDLADKLPFLRYLNIEIEKLAGKHNLLFADIYARFQGHGVGKPDTYYWPTSPIEPSAKGAQALCELWLETLSAAAIW